jgi:hypothetical protein
MTEAPSQARYWIAHTRGPDFNKLRDRGFITFFPTMDDYVFLEANEKNEKLLRKQSELCVSFLKAKDDYPTISYIEMMRMFTKTLAPIAPKTKILAVMGVASGLDGEVLEVREEGQKFLCKMQGFNRVYELLLDRLEIVEKKPDDEDLGSGRFTSDLLGV